MDIHAEPTTILFATDGTSASQNARAAAAHLARQAGADLHLVHVWSPTTGLGHAQHVDEGIATAVVDAEARLIHERLDCPVAGVHTPHGSRAHGILATAGVVDAGVIVVGGRRLGIVEELFTYRVSEDVVQHSFRPVLLVRDDGRDWPPRHVVVGCDGSPEATRAAGLAAWVARLSEAEVTLVAVVLERGPAHDRAANEARRRLELCAETVGPRAGSAAVTTNVVTRSDVASALRDACTVDRAPNLLAIGARGSSSLGVVPQFSVSRSITHHTHLPLLLVPPTTRERAELHR